MRFIVHSFVDSRLNFQYTQLEFLYISYSYYAVKLKSATGKYRKSIKKMKLVKKKKKTLADVSSNDECASFKLQCDISLHCHVF